MAYIDDLAGEIVLMAGKSGDGPTTVAAAAISDVISDINDRASGELIKSRGTFTITGGSYAPIEMPDTCRRIIELGEYDATTQRIIYPYEEVTEQEYHRFTQAETLSAVDDRQKIYMLVDRSSNSMSTGYENRLQIKVWPVPSTNVSGLARFFVPLTADNADQLGNRFMLKSGAIALLAEWFPKKAELNWRMYLDAVETYRKAHATISRRAPRHTPAHIARHNSIMRGIVN